MATLSSFLRSVAAASRRNERDAKRRQRELQREKSQIAKMQELEQAAHEVNVFENNIEVIQSLHKECGDTIDWGFIAELKAPAEPVKVTSAEDFAIRQEQAYAPGFVDRLFAREEKKRAQLRALAVVARHEDEETTKSNADAWRAEYDEWNGKVELAKLLLKGDKESVLNAVEELNPFAEISDLGSEITFSMADNSTVVEVEVHVHGPEIIPNEMKSLLQSGRASVKKMPKGRFNEIYQDYVCSCVLRVAKEFFAIVPGEYVVITAVDELLNTKTGNLEKTAILSAYIPYETLAPLNMDGIDPSDSMSNFTHNMSFKKTTGFKPVRRIIPAQ